MTHETDGTRFLDFPIELHVSIAQYLAIRPRDLFSVLKVGHKHRRRFERSDHHRQNRLAELYMGLILRNVSGTLLSASSAKETLSSNPLIPSNP